MDQDASDLNRAAIRTHRVETASHGEAGAAEPNQKRWLILAVIAATQLMIVVDASIVNIALPHAQAALHISNDSRQWVVTSYTLSFGGLLLLGGRISDYAGPSGVLVLGQLGFAGASAVAGLAPNSAVLFTARAVQGAFAALMAPAALALLSKTDARSRRGETALVHDNLQSEGDPGVPRPEKLASDEAAWHLGTP